MQSGEVQCQAVKANRMQCANPAFVLVNGIPYCRADFNWLVASKKDGDITSEALKQLTFPLSEGDQATKAEADKIIDSNMGVIAPKEETVKQVEVVKIPETSEV